MTEHPIVQKAIDKLTEAYKPIMECPECGAPENETHVGWFNGEDGLGNPVPTADWFDGEPCAIQEAAMIAEHGGVLIYMNGETVERTKIPRD